MSVSENFPLDEKLKKMLLDGTISIEEYDRLAKAMNKSPAGDEEESHSSKDDQQRLKPITGKKLYRNWENRLLAGVCSGIADYFNIDPSLVRIAFVACLVLFLPLTVLLYFTMIFLLSWDDEDAEIQSQLKGHPWWFALFVAMLIFLPPLISLLFMVQGGGFHGLPVYKAYTLNFAPVARFPLFAMIRRFVCGNLYADLQFYRAPLLSISLLLIIYVLTAIYRSLKDKRKRFLYCLGTIILGVSWVLIFILGSFSYMQPMLIR